MNIVQFTIANGQSLSGAISVGGSALSAIQMPAAWTAANITLQSSLDGTNFCDVIRGGSEVVITASAGKMISLTPGDYAGLGYIKFRSGTSGVPVAQGADRTLLISTVVL